MSHTNKTNILVLMLIALFAVAIAACSPAQAQTIQNAPATGGITVIGTGEAVGTPDQAQVQVGVETFAETVEAATSENEATVQAIMAALDEMGIAPEDIQTVNFSLWPEQRYGENGPEGVVGYRVMNQVNVTIKDINKVGEVLAGVTEAGANSIHGVYFTVADPAGLEAEARAAAIANAEERAASLAELSNVELGEVVVITEVIGQPQPFYGMGGGFDMAESAVPSVSPGQLTYTAQVQVTYAIR